MKWFERGKPKVDFNSGHKLETLCVGKKILFQREQNNGYDRFVVAGKTHLKRRIKAVRVGHILYY